MQKRTKIKMAAKKKKQLSSLFLNGHLAVHYKTQ